MGKKLPVNAETRATRAMQGLDPDTGKPKCLPCPFCGDTTVHLHKELRDGYETCKDDPDAYAFYYACNSCACHGGWSKSETSALRWWNMRTRK